MSSMSSLQIAVSGLSAAQTGLYVTGHNTANVNSPGYTRQMVFQSDFKSLNVGMNAQKGLGTSVSQIMQIRNSFLDASFRKNIGKAAFYDVKYMAGFEIESILGELEGQYKFQSVITDMYEAIQEMMKDPASMETRGNFITSAIAFIEKSNDTYNTLFNYQQDLNDKVKKSVIEINTLANKINNLNQLISSAEASGDYANDYRDSRNLALDELAAIATISYKERPNGTVDVLIEGKELVVNGLVNTIGLRYTAPKCNFVEPVFTNESAILEYDPNYDNARRLFNNTDVSVTIGNDNGSLKALIIARGLKPANYTSSAGNVTEAYNAAVAGLNPADPADAQAIRQAQYKYEADMFNITNCTIPKVQLQLDTLVNSIVTMINNMFSPIDPSTGKLADNAPYDQNGVQNGYEIFSRGNPVYSERFDEDGVLIPEDKNEYYSLYTIGNIVVNPVLVNPSGYAKIATSYSGSEFDNNLVKDILSKWSSGFIGIDDSLKLNVDNFYRQIVTTLGVETNEAKNYVAEQTELVLQIESFRSAMSDVSMDEEMTNMMKYQHAYNSAARILNVIDSMIDKIVNGTGRVGM